MKKRFYSKGAKIHFYTCFIALVVTIGILLVNWIVNDNSVPSNPHIVKLEKSATLRGRVDNEDFEVNVKKGSEIKILGVRKGTMLIPEQVWVELEDGSRGYIYCTDFDLEYTALVKDEKAPVPVKVKGFEKDKMVIPWCIDGRVTQDEAEVEYAIRFYRVDDEGKKIIYNLNTMPNTGKVLYGLNVQPNGLEDADDLAGDYDISSSMYEHFTDEIRKLNQQDIFWIEFIS